MLTPADISERTGIPATECWQRGEVRGGRVLQSHLWEFETDYDESETLDAVISRTLLALSSARDSISRLAGVERMFWCAVFSDTPETTISLSPATLSGMADLRAELSCSIYAASFDDEPGSTPIDPLSTH
jgi:hypothetical protein